MSDGYIHGTSRRIQTLSIAKSTYLRARQATLHAQCHDRVDYVVVVLFQGLDSLLAGHGSLLHDKLNVLALKALLVDFLIVVVVIILLRVAGVNGLALAMVVTCVRVLLLLDDLLGCGGLSLGVEVLDLGLAEDAAID